MKHWLIRYVDDVGKRSMAVIVTLDGGTEGTAIDLLLDLLPTAAPISTTQLSDEPGNVELF